MSANFTPVLNEKNELGAFRFWCQKVLPLTYDDSLSYYELLCKVVKILNDAIENQNKEGEDIRSLYNAYVSLQNYTNQYFDSLDVQEEINNKLDNMANSGKLYEIIKRYTDPIIGEQDEKIDVLKARMDTFASLPEGSTSGNAELLDIRVGYNGTTYPSAGDAVREQANELNENLVDKPYGITTVHLQDFINGYIPKDNGVFKDNISDGTYVVTDFIEIPTNSMSLEHNFVFGGETGCCFYDENKAFIEGVNNTASDVPLKTILLKENYKYARFTDYKSNAEHSGLYVRFISKAIVNSIDTLESVVFDSIERVGIVCNTNEYVDGFVNSKNGLSFVKDYEDYSHSKRISVHQGETLLVPYTNPALNDQIGCYYLGEHFVGVIERLEPSSDYYYHVPLRSDISYDNVIVNVYKKGYPNEFTVYANEKKECIPYYRFVNARQETSWYGKKWVAMGDSFTEGAYTDICGRYTDYVSEYLGLECLNLGVGGSQVQSYANNFTTENGADADLITIWGSINNMAKNGDTCGSVDDEPNANGSLMAKWKYTIEKVLTINSKAKVIIIGCPIGKRSDMEWYEAYNSNGDTVEKSTEMIGKLARRYSLPFIDMYNLSGFNSYNFGSNSEFGYDGIHANRKGVIRLSNILISQLLNMQDLVR